MENSEFLERRKQNDEALAKSLGYSSFKDMKATLSKQKLSGGIKSRLEQGGGIKESISGGIKSNIESVKKSLNPKTMAKKAYNDFFDGDDFLSAYMRGRIVKKPGDSSPASKLNPKSPTAGSEVEEGLTPNIANDVLTIRNAISSLLSFEREKGEQSKDAAGDSYFKQQDDKEASLEGGSPIQVTGEATAEDSGGGEDGGGGIAGFLGTIVKVLAGAFVAIFAVGALAAILPAAAIAGLFIGIFKGIMAGFEKYKETGDLGEAIITGLGALLDFITFGMFGEENIRNMFKAIGDFTAPIIEKIGSIFSSIMDWVKNNVGIPSFNIPISDKIAKAVDFITLGKVSLPTSIKLPAYYPFKDDPSNESDVTSAPKPKPEPELTAHDKMKAEIMDSEEMQPDTDKLKGFGNTADGVSHLTKGQKVSTASLIGGFSGDSQLGMNSPTMVGVDNSADASSTFGNSAAPTAHKFGTTQEQDEAAMGNFLQGGGIDSAMGNLSSGTAAVPGAMDNAANVISDKINAGGVTPNPVTPFGAASSGAVVERGSIDVESGQREESMGSGGSVVNSPSITNNSGSMGSNIQPVAPVINFEFANGLQFT
jgi:hypothetical protein